MKIAVLLAGVRYAAGSAVVGIISSSHPIAAVDVNQMILVIILILKQLMYRIHIYLLQIFLRVYIVHYHERTWTLIVLLLNKLF